MKALIVCPTYPPNDVPCGVGDYTRALAERMASRVAITVAASTGHRADGSAGRDTMCGIRVVRLTERWDRRAALALVALVRRERFDVVHLQYTPMLYGRTPWAKLMPLLVRLGSAAATVVTPHTLVGGYRSARLLAPLLIAASHRIITPNPEVASMIARRLPMFAGRVRDVPIGSNIPFIEPAGVERAALRTELGAVGEACVVAHFGFASPGKGIETLLEAMAVLAERRVKHVLAMVGGPSPEAPDYYRGLQARAEALGLGAGVRWLGHVEPERVALVLGASDVYVLPYDAGISPRRGTLIAGVMHRLAIVATRPPGDAHPFRDGEHLVLVPPRDPGALAAALERLAGSPELRDRLRAGVEALAPRFEWSAIADATLGVYAELA
jgi:glycosyltransferase involved in cell wall biosynthesis